MYTRILVPFDGSPTSTAGLDEAIRLAVLTGAQLRLLFLVDDMTVYAGFAPYGAYVNDIVPGLREAGKELLAKGRDRAVAAGVATDVTMFEGLGTRLADVIAQQAREWPADLIVLGTHGRRGVNRLFLGSDAEQVLRLAPVPVLLVRASAAQAAAQGELLRAA